MDADPRAGRFILSGSSRFLTIPTLSESLAGRLGFVDLWPLSMRERAGAARDFLATIFADPAHLIADSPWSRRQYLQCVIAGGYPEVLTISSPTARRAWYDGYLNTIVNRDIRDFATIVRGESVTKLLGLIAARAGSFAVLTDLAQGAELARDTARNYLSYLDMVYLTTRLPAWSSNLTSRLVKTPKLYLADSGLAAHVTGVDIEEITEPGHPALGPLVETFVATELRKAITNTDLRVGLFHLRTADKREIDFILEGPRGRVVAIEVKASTSPGADALRNLRWVRDHLGDRLHAGIRCTWAQNPPPGATGSTPSHYPRYGTTVSRLDCRDRARSVALMTPWSVAAFSKGIGTKARLGYVGPRECYGRRASEGD